MSQTHQAGRAEGAARRQLLRLLRVGLASSRGTAVPALPTWTLSKAGEEELVRIMMRHRVASFLHPLLDAQSDDDQELPVEILGLCRQAYFTILRRNVVALDVGEALLTELFRVGIDAVPRGAWAWMRGHAPVHRDPGQRPIDGLYVSLSGSSLTRGRDIARGVGFREMPGQPGGDAVLWRRMGRLRLSLEFGVATPPPRPQRCLIDAVSGLVRVRFARWLGLIDVHRLVDGRPLDWGPLQREARQRGLERDLIGALRLSRELLGTRLPPGVVAARGTQRARNEVSASGSPQGM